jgi:hypothetical protein
MYLEVNEVYKELVNKFDIGKVFHTIDNNTIYWIDFINSAISLDTTDELSSTYGFNSVFQFSNLIKSIYPDIFLAKNNTSWRMYLLSLIHKKQCDCCYKIINMSNFLTNSTKCNSCSTNYYKNNRQEILLRRKNYYSLNKETIKYRSKIYYEGNKHIFRALGAKRRATKLKATPKWANLVTIKEIYQTCPEGYHVDHVVPLHHTLVCGLHCEFNLQHLPAEENLSKGNRFEV